LSFSQTDPDIFRPDQAENLMMWAGWIAVQAQPELA
jgi:hypothetical protein